MIKVDNLFKTYHTGSVNEVIALKDISVEINSGEFVVIMGSNGSGKSTFLNLLSGTQKASSGVINLDGIFITNFKEYQRSKWIARVFQNPQSGTAANLTILENFRLAALRTRSKGLTIGMDNAFRSVVKEKISVLEMGLENAVDKPMGSLSGGQRQALTLLMAVMDDVKVLLLDEPTAALDPKSADLVMKLADKLISEYKLTTILITHNIKEALTYGTRIIQMADGEILRDLNQQEKLALTHVEIAEWFM